MVCKFSQVVEATQKAEDGDEYSYDIYFVDFGNAEKNVPSSSVCSVDMLLNVNPNEATQKEIESLLKFPFAAVCCELKNKKECN